MLRHVTMMKPFSSGKFMLGVIFLCVSGAAQMALAPPATLLRGAPAMQQGAEPALDEGFREPPKEARLRCYWWWLNGHTTRATITRDLTEMRQKGYGGVLLVDANGANQNGNDDVAAGPEFGSVAWTQLYLHALKEADRLGLEVTLNIVSGWNLGGPEVKAEQASKLLTWSRSTVLPGAHGVALPEQPAAKNGFFQPIAVLAYPLRHGVALAGEGQSGRRPLSELALKSAAKESGFSMPDSTHLLTEASTNADADADMRDVVDISGSFDSAGHSQWVPPAGSKVPWEILRIGYTDSGAKVSTASGAWQGLAIDYLDPSALDLYWKANVLPLLEAAEPLVGRSLKYVATDSWELGGTNWTGRFREEFQRRRGYDPVPYLPIVAGRILGDRDLSDRFLADLRRTVADLVDAHYDHMAELAKPFGLGLQCESGGPHGAPIDALETFRSSAVPQTEYWAMSPEHRSRDDERYFVKEAAAAAHLYGRPLAAAEGMTTIGNQWNESLGMNLKPSFDQALTEGMNRLVWHEFTSSPAELGLPGQEYFAGTHLNPNVTWWQSAGPFLKYLNRAQFLMQRGEPVNDVLYYYGDNIPNFVRLKRDDPAKALPGYDYDVTSTDTLLHRLLVRDGVLSTPEGIRYRALVLPPSRILPLAALEFAERYVLAGGLLVGDRPLRSQGIVPEAEARKFEAVAERLWKPCDEAQGRMAGMGKGQMACGASAHDALGALGVLPDFDAPAEQLRRLDYVHRRDGEAEIYFIRNTGSEPLKATVTLRVGGKQPEVFDAVTGEIWPTMLFAGTADARTRMPLDLEPFGSVFVVLRTSVPAVRLVNLARNGKELFPKEDALPSSLRTMGGTNVPMLETSEPGQYVATLSDGSQKRLSVATVDSLAVTGAWTLRFPAGWGAPEQVAVPVLASWTSFSDPGVRYFSGTATYRTTVTLTAKQLAALTNARLNLGEVHEVAGVRVNGSPTQILWKAPYAAELKGLLRPGENVIEVDVTNLWPNRLIGDAQPGTGKRYTWTNIRKYTSSSPLLPSGLLGPVRIEPVYRTVMQ